MQSCTPDAYHTVLSATIPVLFFLLHMNYILTCDSVVITSDAFNSKMQPARHRMVYALLRDEMAQENGIHALQLRTMTPEEETRQRKKKEAEAAARDARTEAQDE